MGVALMMNYVSFGFYVFLILLTAVYYILPLNFRWLVLLAGSGFFYYFTIYRRMQLVIFAMSIGISYLFGILIQHLRTRQWKPGWKQLILITGIVLSVFPLFGSKCTDFFLGCIVHKQKFPWIIPVGLSFYSLQIIVYLTDIYKGRIDCQRNPFKYALFISFFPHIIQGPIPRYQQLEKQLFCGHRYDSDKFMKGIQLIIWGFFLKYMIANKASVIVDTVFNNHMTYQGLYVAVAGVLYSFQLYTDFLSCVTISQGVSQLFGICLTDNFNHPYFSVSVKEFWRRWHISLSHWLRDYIYIPLGGNRGGRLCKYRNLVLTFVVSGIWHGASWKFLFWGLMHGGYQIAGDLTHDLQEKIYGFLQMPPGSRLRRLFQQLVTFCLITAAWIIFRADSLKTGIKMIRSLFTFRNPWILFDNSIFRLGLNQKECEVLGLSLLLLLFVSILQERGIVIRNWFVRQCLPVRWSIYLCAVCGIWVLGTYGFGFDANDFIYGGF